MYMHKTHADTFVKCIVLVCLSLQGFIQTQASHKLCVSHRGAAAEECTCVQLDFVAAKMLNKESLVRFAKDRSIIAALNDRFVALINMVSKGWIQPLKHYSKVL